MDASAVTYVDQLRVNSVCIVQNLEFQIHALLTVFQDHNPGLVRLFKTDHLLSITYVNKTAAIFCSA